MEENIEFQDNSNDIKVSEKEDDFEIIYPLREIEPSERISNYYIVDCVMRSSSFGLFVCGDINDNYQFPKQYLINAIYDEKLSDKLYKIISPKSFEKFDDRFIEIIRENEALFIVFKYKKTIKLSRYLTENYVSIYDRVELAKRFLSEAERLMTLVPALISYRLIDFDNIIISDGKNIDFDMIFDFSDEKYIVSEDEIVKKVKSILYYILDIEASDKKIHKIIDKIEKTNKVTIQDISSVINKISIIVLQKKNQIDDSNFLYKKYSHIVGEEYATTKDNKKGIRLYLLFSLVIAFVLASLIFIFVFKEKTYFGIENKIITETVFEFFRNLF